MPRKGAGIVRFPRVIFCGFIFTLILVCVVSGPAAARGRAGIFGMRVVNGALAEAMLQQDGLPDNIASVSGTVADGSSKPVPGATVTVKSAAGVKQSARTDSKGKFWIGGLAAGDSVPLDVLMEPGVMEEPPPDESATAPAATAGANPSAAATATPATATQGAQTSTQATQGTAA